MAHWAKLRAHELSQLFHLKRERMPHASTWSRVLGHGVEPNEVEQIVGRFAGTGHQNSSAQAGQDPPGNGWQNAAGNHPVGGNGRGA